MQDLLKNAWLGWQSFTENGKYGALLFAALIFLGMRFFSKTERSLDKPTEEVSGRRAFLGYTITVTVCCVFPASAALLMLYQTKFYDYEWIWSLVPLTIVTAWAAAVLLTDKNIVEKPGKGRLLAVFLIGVIFLSGNQGKDLQKFRAQKQERETAVLALNEITQNGQEKNIFLLAPREIMEYARTFDGSIRLPYGRNMWDKSLDGYAYDMYTSEITALYEWMCSVEELADFDKNLGIGMVTEENYEPMRQACLEGAGEAIAAALAEGVNCFVFPGELREDAVQGLYLALQNACGEPDKKQSGFYVFTCKRPSVTPAQ